MTKREEIMKKARELGEAIKESDEYRELVEAQNALENDKETQKMLKEYDQKRNEIQMKQMVGQDIRGDIEILQKMEEKIMERETMIRYSKAEADFKDLIEEANKEIVRGMGGEEKEEE